MKKIDKNKKCFIICANDILQLNECLLYLDTLIVPEGFTVEVLTIEDAKSIAAGYNEGMRASNAKYKVYLHQDTFIVEKNFIDLLIKTFKRSNRIGMIGMVGAEKLAKDAVMWHEKRCGNFYRLDQLIDEGYDGIELITKGYREVEAVDGLLIATQYDIEWREDILKGWDFYDVSQSLEFKKAGYKVVVPAQKETWVIHSCGAPSFWNYEKNRRIILNEYPEIAQSQPGRLRILYLNSIQITLLGLYYSLSELGHNVFVPQYQVTLDGKSERDIEKVEELLEEGHYDLVVTYDFSQGVSIACEKMGVKYYAWIYDAPLMELFSEQVRSPINYISTFDKKQLIRLQDMKIPHLFHLPLASEVGVFGAVNIRKKDERLYKADVSFVGRLYDNRGYNELFDESSLKFRKEADEIVTSCGCRWDENTSLFGKASDELIDYIVSRQPDETWTEWKIDKRYYCESMKLVRRCNEVERVTILNRLAERFNVVLYSDDSPKDMLHNVTIRPWVDYVNDMPKVFYLSKINLNITSRSIETGVPQRVWDIMSVGGFCITNYQEELEDYFVIDKELVVYHSLDELMEKIDYYLKHEDERLRIAINGYKAVRNKHDSKERLQRVIQYIFDEEEEKSGTI